MSHFTNQQLIQLCNKANWKEFNITMKNGDILTITPCTQACNHCNQNNVEYFLVDGPLPWMGEDNIEALVKALNNYEQSLAQTEKSKKRIHEFFVKNIETGNYDDETWSFYSDWHKDIYGFRPHGRVCGTRT